MTSLRDKYGHKERGISIQYLNRWGAKSVDGGVRFPNLKPDGSVNYYAKRLIPPRQVTINGKKKKQRFDRPAGVPNALNFLPLVNDVTWAQVLSDPTIPIYFVESEFKAAALAQLGYAVVTAGSVMGHRDKRTKTARCLNCIDWRYRIVRICFDNDLWINTDVQDGLFDLSQELMNRGVQKVEVVVLPDVDYDEDGAPIKAGLDDLLKEQGKKAKEWFESLQRLPVTDPMFGGMGKYRKQPRINVAASLNFDPLPMSVLTREPPKRSYVLEPWIPTGKLAALTAAGGFGKGFLAMGMAVHIATGEPWFGYPVTKGRVVIISLEDSQEELNTRLHDTVDAFLKSPRRAGLSPRDKKRLYQEILDNVRCVSVDGQTLHLITEKQGEIFDTSELSTICQKIKPLAPLLVIVDPMSQLHGLNPNANEVGSALVRAFGYVRNEVGCAVFVMTHVSKGAQDKGNRTETAMLGAYAVSTGSRSVINADVLDIDEAKARYEIEPGEAVDKFAIFVHSKGNYGAKAKPMYLMRGLNGVWELPDENLYPRRDASAEYEQWWSDLQKWVQETKREAFSPRDVTENHLTEISKDVGERVAKKYFKAAMQAGKVRKLSKAEMKTLPANQRKGAGARYCLADS